MKMTKCSKESSVRMEHRPIEILIDLVFSKAAYTIFDT